MYNTGLPYFFTCFYFCLLLACSGKLSAQTTSIASNGKADVDILFNQPHTNTREFALAELADYLKRLSGAGFEIKKETSGRPAIRLSVKKFLPAEAYSLFANGRDIFIEAQSDRALLFAVYDLLGRLGCVWLAPNFDFYNNQGESIPQIKNLSLSIPVKINRQPAFTYRKIDVEEGHSFTPDNLREIINWMPKAGYNTLMVPVNFNNNGRVSWDNWREALIPELKKRDLLLEVGGHGYQNFINAGMEGKTLFDKHPDWFGKDSSCRFTPSERLVFNTENPHAVNYFIQNIVAYLKLHPEINIFEIWPPDIGRWADCEAWQTFGTPEDRQAALANKVNAAIKKVRPGLRLEIIANGATSSFPGKVKLDHDIIVDYCPINQSFEKQVYDESNPNNKTYATEIRSWKKNFNGDLGLFSYYRNYAWSSAPNVIPHYLQKDMKWFKKNALKGISTFAEPGDWVTYELNFYVLGQLAWNPNVNVDSLSQLFFLNRYKESKGLAEKIYKLFEEIVPAYSGLPYTSLKPADTIMLALNKLAPLKDSLEKERLQSKDLMHLSNLYRLQLMLRYLEKDLLIVHAIASKQPREKIVEMIREFVTFLQYNLGTDVFMLTGDHDVDRFIKKYGLTNKSLTE